MLRTAFLAGIISLLSVPATAQWSDVDFNAVDSLIETVHSVELCLKEGKEDLRFFQKTPEKYSDFKSVFFKQVNDSLSCAQAGKFQCGITAEVNCKGRVGNFTFAIEPRIFYRAEYSYFQQLIGLIGSLKDYPYQPAMYLGEAVNSKVRLKLLVKEGKLYME
ncbi:MAG: hypothetical protein IPH78_11690 [Bacteroidetes bacterium]|nr:hypothetical protein [Bacteroidota bacterium]MBK8660217.1 hypothetical protein [Bacteroidota bacterium]